MKDLISLFHKHDVAYALVGGYAVNYYGYTRMTQDIDFLLLPSKENAENVMNALEEFGFGNAGIQQELFEHSGTAVHLGVEPNRIDLLTHLEGMNNNTVFNNIEQTAIEGTTVNIICRADLILAKKTSRRLRDQADAEELEKLSGE
ncbi:MAG: hypothetical protein B1H09_07125 [Gemmatimonadaceae bacterium 4484_173]|nr:MAG: hypothetical protein B1H09_07125 [Gemmatimonadaceae bacterium 4484_173]